MVDRWVDACLWPEARCAEMIAATVHAAGIPVMRSSGFGVDPETCCAALGLECERAGLTGATIEAELRLLPPGVLHLPGRGYLLILESGRSRLRALAPDLSRRNIAMRELRRLLLEAPEAGIRAGVHAMLEAAGIPPRRRLRAAKSIMEAGLCNREVGTAWQIRVPPGSQFQSQLRDAGLPRQLVVCMTAHLAEVACLVLAWFLIGNGALNGYLDRGWLWGWALLLLTLIPLRLISTWLQGALTVGAGGLLRQRLLAGALLLDSDLVRGEGTGQLLGRVIDSEALESLAAGGGLAALFAGFEMIAAIAIMAAGAAPVLQPLLFVAWLAATALLIRHYYNALSAWTAQRLSMTESLIEKMAGHRTRLAQQARADHHRGEDQELESYIASSRRLDRIAALSLAVPSRGWLLIGILALTPVFLAGGSSQAQLAASVGAVLLGYQSLRRFSLGIPGLAAAGVAWKKVSPMFRQASRIAPASLAGTANGAGPHALDAQELAYSYPSRREAAIQGCSLRIAHGDMVLLEGQSGSGKSTLAALFTGSRKPDAGLLLSGGLDRHVLGEQGWRRRIATAPQYHENHILSAPLAFNLLMGRCWPPGPAEMREADELCRDLGLGPLLERMPSGIMQTVGETGWQLSQGERSRVFLARALLQGADLTILDETLAALDPGTLRTCIECALRRAKSLLVIAHP